jgi:predicted permease
MNRRPGQPPRLAEWLITRTVPPRDRDAVLGDLEETFHSEALDGPKRPRLWYWGQALLFTVAYSAERLRSLAVRGRGRRAGSETTHLREAVTMNGWWREVRFALRALRKRPGFIAATVGTLALGIGASTAIFSTINGVMLRPLPYPEPDRLVFLSESWKDQAVPGGSSMNAANFRDLQASVRTIEGMTPYTFWSGNLTGGDRPQRVRGLVVGHEFFSTLGAQPRLGRDFTAEEGTEGGPDVVIVSHELWRDVFGSDRDLVGRDIMLNDAPYTVVGVLPEAMEFPGDPRIYVPLQWIGADLGRGGRNLNGIGRLASGATVEMAQQDMMAGYAPLEETYPQNENWTAWADPLHDRVVRPSQQRSLRLLGWAVGLVLLIACLNVANLLLVRAENRHRELAVRVALGAGKARLIPHFLSEGLLLSVIGGVLGVGVAYGGLEAIKSAFSSMLPRTDGIALDTTALLFALVVSLVSGVAVGLVPVARARSVDLQSDLKDGARGASRGGSALRQTLVVGEISLAVVILGIAALLGNSFYRVARIDTGVRDPEHVLVAQVTLGSDYQDTASRARFFRELMTQIEALPGVTSAGLTSRLPLFGGNNFTRVPVVGDPERAAEFVEWRMVTPGFFGAVGVSLEEGRMMDASDAALDTVRTIMVTRELSRQLFADESPLGRRIDVFGDGVGMEVIGVVSDLRDLGHERPTPPGVYAAAGNAVAPSTGYVLVRTATDALGLVPRLRELVEGLDPDLPVFGTRTLDDVVRQRLGGRMFSVSLLGIFAVVALMLGAIGIYGVVSYAVSQRTREMGVRLALGARGVDVVRLVVRHGVRLTVLGVGLGLIGTWVSTRWISSQLFDVEATDPVTYLAVAVLLGGVSLLASYVPARRASRTDPLEALRSE